MLVEVLVSSVENRPRKITCFESSALVESNSNPDMYNFLYKSGRRSVQSPQRRNHKRRSHSPNSPNRSGSSNRSSGKSGHGDDLQASTKSKHDLAYHVRQVKTALTHFKDVILKNKLEMLSGNGTVVLEAIANVHTGEFAISITRTPIATYLTLFDGS